jgi:uncharacterized repeat protein (TIGR01451 family)
LAPRFFLGVIILLLVLVFPAGAQNGANLWEGVDQVPQGKKPSELWVQPQVFRAFNAKHNFLRPLLRGAPKEATRAAAFSQTVIHLPMPDGTLARFRFVDSPVMAPELAAQFPEIKTYLGQGIDDPKATVRFDLTPAGFHAQILSPNGTVYIEPYLRGDTNLCVSFYKRDYQRAADGFQCLLAGKDSSGGGAALPQSLIPSAAVSGASLRIYRLACAATGEYTQFQGGTVPLGMAAIVTAINRVTGVYESELAIRLVLVANNNLIVYTNASTDPYNNLNPTTLLSQNQSNLDAVIGNANYDIGHVFSTGGGGLAALGVACLTGSKARGETGMSAPVGDGFYIDYVAHEMGHQFGANHCFNSSSSSCGGGNRNAATAYEPGSGSTIMAYAGICSPDDLQPHSDPYFHSVSIDEIIAYTTTGSGNSCPTNTATGNNAPNVSAGANYTIPKGTPFILTASGSDPDGDTLTFCWEERDLGPSITLATPDNGSSPLFRSFNPTNSPSRVFPRLSDILNNTTTAGEMLPTTSRTMQFCVIARDNRAGGGGVSTADMQVVVNSNAGPFVVTSPNTPVTWAGSQTVTWNVAGTTNAPVNATSVNILLSTNGGATFPIALATNVPNNGSRTVVLPSITSSLARIKVEAVGNIFFDLSDTQFSIVPPAPVVVMDTTTIAAEMCAPGNGVIDPGETVMVNFALKNTGNANATNLVATLLTTNGIILPSGAQNYGSLVAGGSAVSQPFIFTANGTCGGSVTAVFQLQDGAASLGTVSKTFSLGILSAGTQTLTNSTAISIVDNATASPYPSAITVSNLSGTVTKVTVRLRGLTHTSPDDIDVLLVGPGGQKTYLMSDVGGANSVTNLTLTFDDSASTSLPDTTKLSSGTNKPTNFDTGSDAFPGPAPSSPYATNLAVFNGVNPNGTWSLYVRDDRNNDVGNIGQGWTLAIATSNLTCCPGAGPSADLAIGESVTPPSLNVGSNVTCTIAVTNLGLSVASNVVVSSAVPAALVFGSAIVSQGTWTNSNGTLIWSLGTMGYNSNALATVSAIAVAGGFVTNTVSVISSFSDPVTNNNVASAGVFINSPPTISAITNQVTDEDVVLGPIGFLIGDGETPASALTLIGASSNTNLVPATNIVFGGSASNRTVTLTPAPNQSGSTTIGITVSDGALSSSASFVLTVNAVNDPPVLAAITNYVIDEGATLMFTNTATDVDLPAQSLSFSLSNAPAGAVINATNGVFSWTPSEEQGPSTNVITVLVTDSGTPNLTAAQSFTVVVNELNSAPVLPGQTDRTTIGIAALIVTNTATDSDLPTNALAYVLTAAPSGASIDTNGIITWTPSMGQIPSTNVLTTVVTDFNPWATNAQHLSATNTFTVVVNPLRNGPALAAQSDRTLPELTHLVVTNTASDSDVPFLALSYQLLEAPSGAQIDTNGVITWTPSEPQGPSTNTFTTVVTDNGAPQLSATNSFLVLVTEVNSAPSLAPITDRTIVEGDLLVITNSASDADIPANTLTFSLGTNAPVGASIDPTNGVFTWTPNEAQGPSTNVITVSVSDDGTPSLSSTQSFTVVVLESNSPPVLAPIADRTITAGQTLLVTNSASDPDLPANVLTFGLDTNAPAGAAINSTNGLITWAVAQGAGSSTNLFVMSVVDDGVPSLGATQSFTVVVLENGLARSLPSVPQMVVVEGETLVVTNFAGLSNSAIGTLVFGLATNAPAGASIDATNGVFTWTPTEAQGPSTNLIQVMVTDQGPPASSAAQSFTVIVLETNSPPVMAAIADRTIHAGATLTFVVSATDPDIPTNTLMYSLDAGVPTGAGISANGVFTFTTSDADVNTTNQITVRVTDDGVPPMSAAKSFNVAVVSRPVIDSITRSNDFVVITWRPIPGQNYRLEYKGSLAETNWSDLGADVTASGATATQLDSINAASQRLYRVAVVP